MIEIRNIVKKVNKGFENEKVILNHINFQIQKGEMVAIMGKSGAGKSTLLKILAGLEEYDEGKYYCDGHLIKQMSDKRMAEFRNQNIGIVLQEFALINEFNIFENVILPMEFKKNSRKSEMKQIANDLIDYIGLKGKEKQRVKTLSGGEKQRVAIARSLVNNPNIILADEPTGALDTENRESIMKLFCDVHNKGKTIIIVTHDKEIASQADRVLIIKDGIIKKE